MKSGELKVVLRNHLEAGSGRGTELGSLFIKGAPGVGKSQVVESVVDEYNQDHPELDERGMPAAGIVDFRLTLRDPTDLRGIPFPDIENHTAEWLAPDELPNEKSHPKKGILFLDDMTTAPGLVQAAAYQLAIAPHQLGEYKLPTGWVIVAAGNRKQDQAMVQKMPTPLANRFTHLEYEHDIDEWVDWALGHGINDLITGFMASPIAYSGDGHVLFDFDPGRTDGEAFATPRSWERVSRIMSAGFSPEIEDKMINGTVGAPAGSVFQSFRRVYSRLPDPKEIVDKGKFDQDLQNREVKYAMVVAVAQTAKTLAQYENAVKWVDHLDEAEYGVLLIRMLSRDKKMMMDTTAFLEWARKNSDILK